MKTLHAALVAALVSGLAAQPALAASPATAKVADTFSAQLAAFRNALDAARVEINFPGATAAFVLPDGRMGVVAVGVEDKATAVPLSPQARMMSGSTGKTFAAAVALTLAAQGKLDLDAPIARYLGDRPWFKRLPNAGVITTRQLLGHRSGLADHVGNPAFLQASFALSARDPDRALDPEACIAFILGRPALFAPGTGFAYTDTGYLLVGLVIEAASGRPYYDLVRDLYLGPLGLTLTTPSDRRAIPGLSQGEPDWGGAPLPPRVLAAPGLFAFNPGSEWTGGGFATNSLDLARWARALYAGSALPPVERAAMLDAKPEKPGGQRYGLGVSVYESPAGRVEGHSGYFPGYRADLAWFADRKIAVAFQINSEFGVRDAKILDRIRNALLNSLDVRRGK